MLLGRFGNCFLLGNSSSSHQLCCQQRTQGWSFWPGNMQLLVTKTLHDLSFAVLYQSLGVTVCVFYGCCLCSMYFTQSEFCSQDAFPGGYVPDISIFKHGKAESDSARSSLCTPCSKLAACRGWDSTLSMTF